MKWFKKIINFFTYIEEDETDVVFQEEREERGQPQPVERKVENNNFKFPLIHDQEITHSPNLEQRHESKQPIITINEGDRLYSNYETVKHQQEVYDVTEPKIREILEERRKRIKYSYNSSYKPKSMKTFEREKVNNLSRERHKFVNPPTQNKEERIEQIEQPIYNRRRFIPTDVPSPVFGFQNVKSLEKTKDEMSPVEKDKYEESEEAQEKIAIDNIEEVDPALELVERETYFDNELITNIDDETYNELYEEVQSDVDEFLQSIDEDIEVSNKEHVFTERDSSVVDSILYENNDNNESDDNDDSISRLLERASFEEEDSSFNRVVAMESNYDNTIEGDYIKQQYEEESEFLERDDDRHFFDQSTDEKNSQPKNEKEEKKTSGSTLPFNVLMLKSDKDKMTQKMSKTLSSSSFSSVAVEKNKSQKTLVQENQRKNLYHKPSIQFLTPPEEKVIDQEWMESQADKLIEALSYFQVSAEVHSIMQGPAVTQFEITVAHGIKVSKIRNLADDLKLALAAKDIRIQAPIPGKSTIGIEIPNRISRAVRISEIVSTDKFLNSESPLEAALGLDLTGNPVTIDLRKMPHGLIAGATGSGKSVCINSILTSLLIKADPNELKLMLIDPKIVELAPYNKIPHLVSPVITDVKAATAALKWAVEEMERRYQLFANSGVRDLPRFNKWAKENGEQPLPYILIVIDELADLMMMSPTDVEDAICRIAQKARACGIHMIVATQRPSVDVITGLIKSNIPTRIAFAVSSQIDSRTILDQQGAERLLGRGDMLYLGNGMSAPIRLQGTFVTDDEIEAIVDYIKEQGEPHYFFEQEELLKKAEMIEEQDDLFEEVCHFVAEQGTASTSSIQRRFRIGYNRAARLIDMLEQQGFISEARGSKPRDVFITVSDLTSIFSE